VVVFAWGGENRPAVIATAARAIYDGFVAENADPETGIAAALKNGSVQTTFAHDR